MNDKFQSPRTTGTAVSRSIEKKSTSLDNDKSPQTSTFRKEICCFGTLKPIQCFKSKPISKPYVNKQDSFSFKKKNPSSPNLQKQQTLTKSLDKESSQSPYRLTSVTPSRLVCKWNTVPTWADDCGGGGFADSSYDMESNMGSTYIKSINRLQKRINKMRFHSSRASHHTPIERSDSS